MPPEYEDNRLTDPRWQDLNDMFHEAQCLLLNYKKSVYSVLLEFSHY